ncbi:MAG: trimeric intracellular cation channel family protein [Ruminococcaceae bacterium]|nr:trimeric intracellular cation channel family protein [Oscillospiraceae bacterium]
MNEIVKAMEIIGTIAFAVSGSIVAIDACLDIFGVVFVGCITAVGGGIVRDLLLGINPPSIFNNFSIFLIAMITCILVFIIAYINRKRFDLFKEKIEYINNFFDAIGLAAFTIIGSEVGFIHGFANNYFIIIVIGMITGVGGGIFRDVLIDRTPYVFKKYVYAVPTILGSLLYFIMRIYIENIVLTSMLPMILIIIIRFLATKYRWSLPKIHIDNNVEK